MKTPFFMFGSLVLASAQAFASPWVDAQQSNLKHSIDLLVSAGVIQRPVNQYPLMWNGLVGDLAKADASALPDDVQFALRHVNHALDQARQNVRSGIEAHYSDEQTTPAGFGQQTRSRSGIRSYGQITGSHVSARVQVNYTDNSQDGKYVNHHGSHLAVLLGDWAFSAERLDYWWGPGNENALMLSNHAAPMKALRISRANTNYSGPSFLSFIGPWQVTAIAAKQRPHLAVDNEKDFWGIRVSASPLAGLELAYATTASDFVYHTDQQDETRAQQRLSSVDVKYASRIAGIPVAFYGELSGENDQGALPENSGFTLGAEAFWGTMEYRIKSYLEYSDTEADCQAQQASFQCHFETTGKGADYLERGRWLGAHMGPQAKSLSLGANYYGMGGYGGYAKLKRLEFSTLDIDRDLLQVGYQQGLFNGLLKLDLAYWRDKGATDSNNETSASVSWEYRF
ncbi:capsule assembly Wzi family protein [Pseudoalteromonas sp. OOF1S-7]|uniref:capsule assembly Wzi family protein n=1 Tax=Pseudoalteromonas sp. OOF1S-7 TaxID=2917757 RepID=UPI001EF5250E|nr:capsule assembly Wzi family protein [Pseudoalteromonas sp. OOF1S-7]MCG7535680.1 capsule assembly Wzi family protein [Pseudoalteromonas sp. OOF1S-7]